MAIITTEQTDVKDVNATAAKLLKVLGISTVNDLYEKPNLSLSEEKDGKEYVNIGVGSKTTLGYRLSINNPLRLTLFGYKIGTISNYIDCLNRKDYPMELLDKPKLTQADIKKITSLEKVQVPNFWALVAYGLSERLKIDKPLQEMIKANDLPYVCLAKHKELNLFGKEAALTNQYLHNNTMATYLAILNGLVKLIKTNNFRQELVMEYVNLWIQDKEAGLLANVRQELINNIK